MIRGLQEPLQPTTIEQWIFKMIKHDNYKKDILLQNNGSVAIIIAILLLTVVTIIGIASINNSTIETSIATHDMIYKDAFTEADGGAEVGRELLEQNIACLGFAGVGTGAANSNGFSIDTGNGNILDVEEINNERTGAANQQLSWMTDGIQNFFLRENSPWINDGSGAVAAVNVPSDTVRDFHYPLQNPLAPTPYTNVISYGLTELSSGSAVQMAAGYDGKGKSAASGGGEIVYQIDSEFNGERDDYAIKIRWRHLIGNEGSCIY